MAKDFYDCAKNGGKVVSKKTKDGRVIKLCYDKTGKSHLKKTFKKNFKQGKFKKNNKPKRFEAASQKSLQELIIHFNNKQTN